MSEKKSVFVENPQSLIGGVMTIGKEAKIWALQWIAQNVQKFTNIKLLVIVPKTIRREWNG